MNPYSNVVHFQSYEFDCSCGECEVTGDRMKPDLLKRLDETRQIADVVFNINSGMRCVAHNKAEGGSTTSSHLTGWAADIACASSAYRHAIIEAAVQAGFNRIGVSKTFIHLDMDPSKPAGVMWLY